MVVYTLNSSGFQSKGFEDGESLFAALEKERPQLILLDIMLPGMDGIEILKSIRFKSATASIPVIMATAKGTEYDKVMGLDLGADDYLAKPFHMGELLARIRAMLRRREEYTPDIRSFGDVTLNPQTSELSCNGRSVELSRLECRMMDTLMLNHGIYLSSEDLLEKVWGYESDADIGSVWVYISYLRKQLSKVGSKVTVKAKRGTGYMLQQ